MNTINILVYIQGTICIPDFNLFFWYNSMKPHRTRSFKHSHIY